MTTTWPERFNYALELVELKNKIAALEARLKEEQENDEQFANPLYTFEVVLRVATRASTWGDGIDAGLLRDHFNDYIGDIADAVHLTDKGDSIKVQKITEVK